MASYHSKFIYNGKDSAKDCGLIITSFEPDNGFTDSFLSMDNVSDDYFDGTKKYNYGSKYNTQASIQITFIKRDGTDMTLNEFRSYARWLTGARIDSWLDMYAGDTLVYSFLGKFTNLEQYKLDGRTIGCRLTFSSVSPWAYSAPQYVDCSIYQTTYIDEDGVFNKGEQYMSAFDGVLCASTDEGSYFNVTDNGVVYLDSSYQSIINNKSDDLYTYIYLDIDYTNESGTSLSIKNATLGEESIVTDMSVNEAISISAKQFITSSIPNKIFGESFNFVWPRLQPGDNDFVVSGNGRGTAHFTYRYPMKVGDNTMDISVYGSGIDCCECDAIPSYDTVRWEDIVGVPTTLGGYGITDAYTANEVNDKIENIDIEWNDVSNTPTTIEGYGITNAYTTNEVYAKTDVYTKAEVDDKIDDIEISGGGTGGGSTSIDEEELNSMLNDILG